MILGLIAIACLISALIVLIALSIIDLRTWLLPNPLVATFAALGIAFHLVTGWQFLSPASLVLGGMAGFFSLFALRATANYVYKQDTLGLGDVKLMGAAGLWLGPEGVMLALFAGACAGLLHGLGLALFRALKHKERPDFSKLQIPAGPGFAAGIVIAAFLGFDNLGMIFP